MREISSWKDAIEIGHVIEITPNLEKVSSLIKSSKTTLDFIENSEVTDDNAGVFIKNYYDSLIEILHALACKKGLKFLDHLSFTFYIKEILKREDYAFLFDKYRKIRNGLVYYGKEITKETAEKGAIDIKELINFIKKEIGVIK